MRRYQIIILLRLLRYHRLQQVRNKLISHRRRFQSSKLHQLNKSRRLKIYKRKAQSAFELRAEVEAGAEVTVLIKHRKMLI